MSNKVHAPQKRLFAPFKHTFSMRILAEDPDPADAAWTDLDVHSDLADARAALIAYLRGRFEDPSAIRESKDGTFSVNDPMADDVVLTRHYRLK